MSERGSSLIIALEDLYSEKVAFFDAVKNYLLNRSFIPIGDAKKIQIEANLGLHRFCKVFAPSLKYSDAGKIDSDNSNKEPRYCQVLVSRFADNTGKSCTVTHNCCSLCSALVIVPDLVFSLQQQASKVTVRGCDDRVLEYGLDEALALICGQFELPHTPEKDALGRNNPSKFMQCALDLAEYALKCNEVPIGCVFTVDDKIVGRGINFTNKSLCGIMHAEILAIDSMLEAGPNDLFKLATLYVSVEPCLMCAAALKQLRLKKVYFGAANDRFGGCGSIKNVNRRDELDHSYSVFGGVLREEAIMLLRRFYMQQNPQAPVPKTRKNRVLKHSFEEFDPLDFMYEDTAEQ